MKAKDIIDRVTKLKGDRATWESNWEDVTTFVAPRYGGITSQRTKGGTRMEKVFDCTALDCNDIFAAGMLGHLCTGRWLMLRGTDDSMDDWYAEATTAILEEYAVSNFAQKAHEMFKKLGCLGTACLFQEPGTTTAINFQDYHIGNFFIVENSKGLVDTLYRQFRYTARQAVQEFKLENVGHSVQKAYQDEKHKDDLFDFIHTVYPRIERNDKKLDTTNMLFASVYIAVKDKHIIEESGFPEFPFCIPRLDEESGEVYGRSIGIKKLPEIKVLNKSVKLRIRAVEKKIDPPLQVPDDGFIRPLRTMPGGLNYYRSNTQDRIVPLETKGDIRVAQDFEEQLRDTIRQAWSVNLFALLAEKKNMTATEVLERVEEKLVLLGPMLSRLQAEWFNPMITRTLGILMRSGRIPEPPSGLEDFEIEYMGKLAIALKLAEIKNLRAVFEYIAPIVSVSPEAMDTFATDTIVKGICHRMGIPKEWLNTKDAIETIREEREAMLAAQAAAEAAPKMMGPVDTSSPMAALMENM
jgi:hypothetical protein